MPKDIRSYFTSNGSQKSGLQQSNIKRKAKPLSSDDDDDDENNKSKKEKLKRKNDSKVDSSRNVKYSSKKRRIIESDDEVEGTPIQKKNNKKPSFQKLKEKQNEKSNIKEIEPFLNDVPKRVERKKDEKANDNTEELLEDDYLITQVKIAEEEISKNEKSENSVKSIKKSNQNGIENSSSPKSNKSKETATKNKTPQKSSHNLNDKSFENKTPNNKSKSQLETQVKNKSSSDILVEEKHTKTSPKKSPLQKKEKKSDLETSVITDEDRNEKKRMVAMLYQKYKNRQSVINHGCKEVPEGKPNCLAGLSFLVTGILESLEREEAYDLIKKYGGKISKTVGKRLNYMVVGEEAGPKKLVDAEELNIPVLSEDDLFNLIREKSGDHSKISPSNSKPSEKKENKSPPSIKKEKLTPEKRKLENSEKPTPEKKIKKESPKKIKNEIQKNIETKIKPEAIEISESIKENEDELAWVEKYKPKNVKEIIGQHGAASNVVKLQNWLSKWYSNHDGKKKLQRPNPWAKNDDGSYFKAALLSGPPGIGKTTTATLVSEEMGFDVVGFNASDTRNKNLLKEKVSELLSNKSLFGYISGSNSKVSKKHVLIMDEVDGMAGNEDRGGIQELINLIKESSVPIICICNDRNHQKMRSLVNYCYDLRFNRPRLEQIKGRLLSICCKENIKLSPQKIEEIILATNNDIRQSINYLALLSAGKELNLDENKNETAKKDLKLGPWDVVRKVFSAEEHKNMTIYEKSDLFFNDYSLAPLFVQQNYLQVMPNVAKNKIINQVAKTADSLSLGDLIDKRIRSNSAWSLLPIQAMYSSVLPGEYMEGRFTGQINFPAWLGKNSKTSKRNRLAQEIHNHTRVRTSGSRLSIRLDYASFILDAIVRPLKEYGIDGVNKSLEVIKDYCLLREDIDSLVELASWPGKKNPMDSVEGKVKAALTRAYNKEVLAYSYSAVSGVKKKKSEVQDDLEYIEGEEDNNDVIEEENEDDDNLENDALIKMKKKPSSKTSSEPSSSKAKSDKKSKSSSSKKSNETVTKGKGKK